eukprot:464691-Rhodomonas_salina.1
MHVVSTGHSTWRREPHVSPVRHGQSLSPPRWEGEGDSVAEHLDNNKIVLVCVQCEQPPTPDAIFEVLVLPYAP